MPRHILTGGPGVGKTTLLRELQALGCAVVEESARELIRERRAAGLPPRPSPQDFATELVRRDRGKHGRTTDGPAPVFFDRCLVESLAMACEAGLLPERDAVAQAAGLGFEPRVFILPPWREIYVQDAERDHDFDHCLRVHAALRRWYAACGFVLHEVPALPPRARAEHVLGVLGVLAGDAG